MEAQLPVGKIATDLIDRLHQEIKAKQLEMHTMEGAIEGIKLLYQKMQEHQNAEATSDGQSEKS